jgi:NAD-dependent aldehyde dehydrogenases
VYAAGEEDVNIAVAAARKALKDPSWKGLSPTDRGALMIKLADLIEQHKGLSLPSRPGITVSDILAVAGYIGLTGNH